MLFPAGLAAAAGVPDSCGSPRVLALVFVYCQGRMLQAARGIPAWREPLLVPLIVVTGLAEGAGSSSCSPRARTRTRRCCWLRHARAAARAGLAPYRRGGGDARPAPRRARPRRPPAALAGTLVPLALVAAFALGAVSGITVWIAALAGLAAGQRVRTSSSPGHRRRLQSGLRARAPAGARRAGRVTRPRDQAHPVADGQRPAREDAVADHAAARLPARATRSHRHQARLRRRRVRRLHGAGRRRAAARVHHAGRALRGAASRPSRRWPPTAA